MKQSELKLFNSLPCGVVVLDSKKKIQAVNDTFLVYSGMDSHAWLGKSMSQLPFYETAAPHDKKIDFASCLKSMKTGDVQRSAMLKDVEDTIKLVFLSGTKTADDGFLLLVTDISKEITCSAGPVTISPLDIDSPLKAIVGHDEKIKELYRLIELAADSMSTVMISGESGTGKELVANAIHQLSDRKDKPFIKVNCSALTETLLESELFGHVKGSFTGAYKDKIGKFEAAEGGTIFLDEIGEISPMIQVKLLRVIQEKTIERVGDNKVRKVNMRIITATNKNLRELVNKGIFREDLFYRLNVFPIYTVPLREHKNDIPLLCEHFIKKFNKLTGKKIHGLNENAYRIIMDYCWPGNVRELENSIEHAFVVCNNRQIDVFDLPQDVRLVSLRQGLCKGIDATNKPAYYVSGVHATEPAMPTVPTSHKDIRKEELLAILQTNAWNRNETAKQLGISRVALWKKMKKWGMV